MIPSSEYPTRTKNTDNETETQNSDPAGRNAGFSRMWRGGGGNAQDPAKSARQAAQMKLDDAAMELTTAVTAGDIPTPTQTLIDDITREISELQTAIDNAAQGVDTAAATALITSSKADLKRISDRFASLSRPTEPTDTTSSTGTTTRNNNDIDNAEMMDEMATNRITISQDIVDPMPWILSPGFGTAHHEISFEDGNNWIYVDNKERTDQRPIGRRGGTDDDRYSIGVYGGLNDDSSSEFHGMIFGAWVDEDGIKITDASYAPTLIDGVAAIDGNPATGKMYLDEKLAETVGTVTYTGDVAGITESDGAPNNVYDPNYVPWIGAVRLTANLAHNTLEGSITGKVDNPPIPPGTITFEASPINNYMVSSGGISGLDTDGGETGNWNARFVHEGQWIAGDFDHQRGTRPEIAEADPEADPVVFEYIRHRGAFGACTGASCPAP